MQAIYSDRKQIRVCLGMQGESGKGWKGEVTKKYEENFWSDGYSLHFDCSNGIMNIHICVYMEIYIYMDIYIYGFPGGSDGKGSTCNAGDLGSIPGLGRSPGGGHGNPLQYSCLENPHGQRSLAGYSPWGHKRVRHNLEAKQQQHRYV